MARPDLKSFLKSGEEQLPGKEPQNAGAATKAKSSESEFSTCVRSVSEAFAADIYLYSGSIDDDGFGRLASELTSYSTDRKNALLILVTHGGIANNGYQIARLFQNTYREFILYTPSYCKSAGTLIALGANKLIMDPFSELGPLDVQLLQPNELAARKSGLLTRSAFEGLQDEAFKLFQDTMLSIIRRSRGHIGFRIAAQLSAKISSNLMAPIYAQMNPDIIGSDKRDLDIAFHYGARLVAKGGNADLDAVFHLINHYPSHDFIIDFEEASGLFNEVEMPSPDLYKLVGLLGDLIYDEADPTVVKALHEWGDKEGEDNESDNKQEVGGEGDGRGAASQSHVDDIGPGDRSGDPPTSEHERGPPTDDEK